MKREGAPFRKIKLRSPTLVAAPSQNAYKHTVGPGEIKIKEKEKKKARGILESIAICHLRVVDWSSAIGQHNSR